MTTPVGVIGRDGYASTAGYLAVYSYDQYGCYAGSIEHYFPIGTGLPPGCTLTAPPAAVSGQIAVWSGTAWVMEPDFRGQTWYLKSTGAPTVINAPGTPDATTYSSTPVAGSEYLKGQAQSALGWCSQQASLASMMGETFTADMKAYVLAISAIASGTDTTSTTLPAQPTDVMTASTAAATTTATTTTGTTT
ncbi:hypothetical protein [Komagataeibacter xylinus]|uniref:Phage tail protein n=1 Tax=Komagataeibacter xylinus TaxID=28448 RepID=A0A857FJ33_KOMXY|nr:hypothetical protein [Komagataeibacter xylinus]QHC34172.1 hypothetical protein FMA36_00360 [Komagataeibacter xylinus]